MNTAIFIGTWRTEQKGQDVGKARAQAAKTGITLDSGALIALDRGVGRMIALIERALTEGRDFRVLAGVVGQAWRDGRKQAALARRPGRSRRLDRQRRAHGHELGINRKRNGSCVTLA